MKKKYLLIIPIIVLLIGLSFFLLNNKDTKLSLEQFNNLSIEEKVDYKLKNMTIDEKIAQMLVLYYTKDTVDDSLKETLKTNAPGGFIIMSDNITTFDKTKKFIDDLKSNSEIPLIISIDQEGGIVQRLRDLQDVSATKIPSMYYLGETKDENLAKEVGKVMAEELRTLGINVVYAPDSDIFSNENNKVIGKRSFGTDSDTVSKMSVALAKGLEENQIIATYKHFPGHGDTDVDSHSNLPVINKSYEDIKNEELIPFVNAINNDAKLIMVGHLALPEITNDNTPATLSKKVVTDILKNDLGYKGLVITDALNMGALTKNYSYEEIYTKAIDAGVDLLLMPNGSKNAINIIKSKINEDRINESVKKILTFKYTYLDKDNTLDKSYLGSSEHQTIIDKIPVK